ncbi:uncharacterized protein Gasu_47090 [Galdieria sulphuraria]|uniref:Uncharacterized protein n=1 Tax=Galdieria sulphuraria TaxID=130081 RepID=M2VWU8_GALSU|nr:uncharacterized protein Gasu_47090 [Galdieria sulphuraria]EME27721.1 hypothetical protein Gasu_47090 [Galdieria sulphuraria]|eukprot:XP_005704241.1 hypothetical protein Gasu_47090 [Galdieria sulphuraria]
MASYLISRSLWLSSPKITYNKNVFDLISCCWVSSRVLPRFDVKDSRPRELEAFSLTSDTINLLKKPSSFLIYTAPKRNLMSSTLARAESSSEDREGDESEVGTQNSSSKLMFRKQKLAFSAAKRDEINQSIYEVIKSGRWNEAVDLVKDDVVLNHIALKNFRQIARYLSSVGQSEEVANLYLRFYELRTFPNFPHTDVLLWFESALDADPKTALRLIQTFRIFRTASVFEKFYGYLIRNDIPHRIQFLISALNYIGTSSRSILSHDHLKATCDFVASCGKPKELLVLFHTLYSKGFILSEHMYEQIMQAAFVARDHHSAVDILDKMRRDLNFIDSVHVALVVATFGRQGLYKEALEFLSKYEEKTNISRENGAIQTALAFAYAQGGEVNLAIETIETALAKQQQLDVNLFVNLLFSVGYSKNEETLMHLLRIGRSNASSKHVYSFYEWSLRGIAKTGDFQLFQRVLKDMKQHDVPVTTELLTLQVRVACGAVRQQDNDALEFIKDPQAIIRQVEFQGLEVTAKLIEALIVSCCWSQNSTAPPLLLEEMKRRLGDYTRVGLLQYQRVCKHLSLTPEQKYMEALSHFQPT